MAKSTSAALRSTGSAPIERQIRRYIDAIGWAVLVLLAVLLILWQI